VKSSSSLARLADAVRVAEPSGNNLGYLVAEGAEELAPLLGVRVDWLRGRKVVPDSHLGPDLARLLELRSVAIRKTERELAAARAEGAALHLAMTASLHGDRVDVDVGLLLGDVLADRTVHFVELALEGRFVVAVRRTKLRDASRRIKQRDRSAYVDTAGLHIRWRSGRGGLDLVGQAIDPLRHRVLPVVFRAGSAG
jgi:hypothetical protein